MPEHHEADRTTNGGIGVHPIMRWGDVFNAAARLAITLDAAGVGGVVRQTDGDVPGFYMYNGVGWGRMDIGDPVDFLVTTILAAGPIEDYRPQNAEVWKHAKLFRLQSSVALAEIGGFETLGVAGSIRHVYNGNSEASGRVIRIKHLGGGGASSSDVLIADGLDIDIPPNGSVTLHEDLGLGKWRVL